MHHTEYDTRLAAYALVVDGAPDAERVLLAWWNGEGRWEPAWTLPGGGVEYEETVEEAVVREVREETGYDVVLDPRPLDVSTLARPGDHGRPFKAVRVVFAARVVGGTLGTLEVGGTTDRAAWLPLAEVAAQPSRTPVVDLALAARARGQAGAPPH